MEIIKQIPRINLVVLEILVELAIIQAIRIVVDQMQIKHLVEVILELRTVETLMREVLQVENQQVMEQLEL